MPLTTVDGLLVLQAHMLYLQIFLLFYASIALRQDHPRLQELIRNHQRVSIPNTLGREMCVGVGNTTLGREMWVGVGNTTVFPISQINRATGSNTTTNTKSDLINQYKNHRSICQNHFKVNKWNLAWKSATRWKPYFSKNFKFAQKATTVHTRSQKSTY